MLAGLVVCVRVCGGCVWRGRARRGARRGWGWTRIPLHSAEAVETVEADGSRWKPMEAEWKPTVENLEAGGNQISQETL